MDFLVFIVLTNVCSIWYVVATATGAFVGAVVNFLIGRYWVFDSTERKIQDQAFRYAIVALGSLLLNTLGVYLVTEYLGFLPLHSKIIVAILVAVGYNFVLQKLFVYR